MTATLTISGKVMGKTQPVFAHWQLVLPQSPESGVLTLQELLTEIVRAEVAAFHDRQRQRRLLQVLTAEHIRLGVEQGKVDSGGSELDQAVDLESAIAAVLDAFVDGLYFVFVDDRQVEHLTDRVTLQPQSELLFLRLVPLVGG